MKIKQNKVPDEKETELYDKITKVETKVLSKLSSLRKNQLYVECKHIEVVPPQCEEYDEKVDYYDKFWKTFIINEVTHNRVTKLTDYLTQFTKKLTDIEELLQKHQQLSGNNAKKKVRRPAESIQKQSQCPYPNCYKSYGSDVSLNLHIKLKHNGGNKTDRQKAAELIWQAKQKGKPVPQFYMNLPPNFVEDYGEKTNRLEKNFHQDQEEDEK